VGYHRLVQAKRILQWRGQSLGCVPRVFDSGPLKQVFQPSFLTFWRSCFRVDKSSNGSAFVFFRFLMHSFFHSRFYEQALLVLGVG